jgi:hypothetical protein
MHNIPKSTLHFVLNAGMLQWSCGSWRAASGAVAHGAVGGGRWQRIGVVARGGAGPVRPRSGGRPLRRRLGRRRAWLGMAWHSSPPDLAWRGWFWLAIILAADLVAAPSGCVPRSGMASAMWWWASGLLFRVVMGCI